MRGSISRHAYKCQARPGVGALLAAPIALLLALAVTDTRAAEPNEQAVHPQKYEIEVRFEPEKGFLHAKASVTLRAEQKTDAIEFALNPRLNILEISDAQGRKLEFTRSGRIASAMLLVRLAEPADPEQEITLTFEYEGTLPREALDYIAKDGILLRDESRWYPAVDLSAHTKNVISITVPADWRALTSGPVSTKLTPAVREKSNTSHWATLGEVSSRSIVAAPAKQWVCGNRAGIFDPSGDKYSLWTCTPLTEMRRTETLASKIIGPKLWYDRLFGRMALPEFTVVQGFPGQQGAIGYSAPGFLVVSEDVIKYHDYSGWAPEFLPHEIAHQWFPIDVTLARSEDGWLAESLAEYLAWRYLREKEPEQARRMVQRAMRDSLAPEPLRPLALGTKLFGEPWNVAYATLYQRGLLVWRTLETVIDRERVDRALREYYQRFAGRSASIADFRKVCEEISGRDLGWFFEYFLNGAQIPEITLRRLPSDAPNVLLGEIVVKNVPADFQVRVEMRVQTEKGVVAHSVATRGEVTPFSLNLPAPATQIMLDPDSRLLRWTEAARRNHDQLALFRQINELEDAGEFREAIGLCQRALALDPDDVATNQAQIHFLLGRMFYRAGKLTDARREFGSVLSLASLDAMDTDFYRAWAHVYRARITRRLGQTAAAQKEARAGLASKSPAMETKIVWPESPGRAISAREALRTLSGPPK